MSHRGVVGGRLHGKMRQCIASRRIVAIQTLGFVIAILALAAITYGRIERHLVDSLDARVAALVDRLPRSLAAPASISDTGTVESLIELAMADPDIRAISAPVGALVVGRAKQPSGGVSPWDGEPASIAARGLESRTARIQRSDHDLGELRIYFDRESVRRARSRALLLTVTVSASVFVALAMIVAVVRREEKFRALIENASDITSILDRHGVIRFQSPSARRILGYEPGETIGTRALDLVHPDDRALVSESLARTLNGEGMVPLLQCRVRHRDGSWRHLEAQGSNFMSNPAIDGFVVNSRDVTERAVLMERLRAYQDGLERLVEERTRQLEAAQKELLAKERLAVLGRLTASVGHELRNPLGTIQNAAFTLSERLSAGADAQAVRAVAMVGRNAARINQIITELLDYTRPPRLERLATDLDAWVSEVLAETELPPGLELERDLRSAARVLVDREQLRRALMNVLSNAVQAAQEATGSPLWVRVETSASRDRVEIRVRDCGPGISDEQRERIFEPLYSTRATGTGLGLSIVSNILQAHGGGVDLTNHPLGGAVATLWLKPG
jgi:PAS domain S-box-containing protein